MSMAERDSEGQSFSIRRAVFQYGAIPTSTCLAHLDSTAAISNGLAALKSKAHEEESYCYVDAETLASCLDLSGQHAKVLIDLVDAITDSHQLFVKRTHGESEASHVDAHAVALYLFAQLYIRQATRPEALDVWPTVSSTMVQESLSPFRENTLNSTSPGGPSSPRGLHQSNSFGSQHSLSSGSLNNNLNSLGSGSSASPNSHNHFHPPALNPLPLSPLQTAGSGGSCNSQDAAMPHSPARSNSSTSSQGTASVQFQQQKSNQLVRRDLQVHLAQHSALLQGYCDYIRRHAHGLLSLVLDRPMLGVQEGTFKEHQGQISAAEFDRLSFLLKSSQSQWNLDQPGSPMDISPTPFSDHGGRLSSSIPLFQESEISRASFSSIADWLACNIVQETAPLEGSSGSGLNDVTSLPLAGVVQGREVDIQGVCKSTVVRGEDDFPSGNLTVIDCHDTVIYALAPLQYAWIFCCSDCTVVIGAVAKMLRVEKCERLTLIAAGVRICIDSCHDCTFYLGINRPPLLIGDNRTLQFGPYNTQYERLPVHLASAGVQPERNLWDQPVTFAKSIKCASPDSPATKLTGANSQSRNSFQLLPPDKLLPFMIPFQGGRGPMCGGAASGVTRLAADLGSFVGLGEGNASPNGGRMSSTPSSPFQLPQAYQDAKEQKVQAVADLRQHIKATILDDGKKRELQSTIQAHFKEWLMSSGRMREIYDLARMEREEGNSPKSPSGVNNHF